MANVDWTNHRVLIDDRSLQLALDDFQAIVGSENVRHIQEGLGEVEKATISNPKTTPAIVYPGSAEEVVAVVNAARRHGVSLWPCGRGRNWGYGSATPAMDNTIVLHLERLNRICEVNEKLAYAVIEPGVTYRQLKDYLDANHPDLWMDCTDGTPGGSVIGNALDRGLGTTHYADHFGTLCGMEVVLASGAVVRTGGGPEKCKTWHTHKWGVGPYVEGLFSQSGFGVVTKAGVWLIPRPEAYESFTFDLDSESDLPRLIDIIRELQLHQIVTSAVHLINEIVSLAVVSQYPQAMVDSVSRLPDDFVSEMRERYGVAAWSFGGGIMGTKRSVRNAKRELRKRLTGLGRLTFLDDFRISGIEKLIRLRSNRMLAGPIDWVVRAAFGKSPEMLLAAPHVHGVLKGIPSDYFVRHAYFKSKLAKPDVAQPDRDDIGLTWFAPIAPMTSENVAEVVGICKPLFERFQFDFYAALLVQNARSMIVLTCIFFRKDDPEQTARAQLLYEALSTAVAASGYQQYRIGTGGMHKLAATAPEFVSLMRSIRNALDPEFVLAPGKYAS